MLTNSHVTQKVYKEEYVFSQLKKSDVTNTSSTEDRKSETLSRKFYLVLNLILYLKNVNIHAQCISFSKNKITQDVLVWFLCLMAYQPLWVI